jgi:hypothetical protein
MTFITDTVVGVVLYLVIPAVSFFVAFLAWKLVLRYQPLRLGGSIVILAVSTLSACAVYGCERIGPVVLLGFERPWDWEILGVEALVVGVVVGVVVTGLFVLWSHRRMRV